LPPIPAEGDREYPGTWQGVTKICLAVAACQLLEREVGACGEAELPVLLSSMRPRMAPSAYAHALLERLRDTGGDPDTVEVMSAALEQLIGKSCAESAGESLSGLVAQVGKGREPTTAEHRRDVEKLCAIAAVCNLLQESGISCVKDEEFALLFRAADLESSEGRALRDTLATGDASAFEELERRAEAIGRSPVRASFLRLRQPRPSTADAWTQIERGGGRTDSFTDL
jgi:hypothetical protein